MLNYLFITMEPGSSPGPNIYYRTFVQSWPLLVYSLVGTFPKPFETGGAGAAVLRPYGLSFPVFLKMNRNTGFKIRIAVPFRPVFALISSTILSAL